MIAKTANGASFIAKSTMFMHTAKTCSRIATSAPLPSLLTCHEAEPESEHERKDHERQHLAVECFRCRIDRIARHQFDNDLTEGLARRRRRFDRPHGRRLLRHERRIDLEPTARPERVDEREANQHRQRTRHRA